jgi:hypothetical protein
MLVLGMLAGGIIFGIGWAISGYCPGTSVVGASEGKKMRFLLTLGSGHDKVINRPQGSCHFSGQIHHQKPKLQGLMVVEAMEKRTVYFKSCSIAQCFGAANPVV